MILLLSPLVREASFLKFYYSIFLAEDRAFLPLSGGSVSFFGGFFLVLIPRRRWGYYFKELC